jgi:hypothetical protein
MKVHVHRRQPAFVAAALRDAGFAVEAHLLVGPSCSVDTKLARAVYSALTS